MVVRLKYRAVLVPLVIYLISGVAMSYFVWAAVNGDRGLKAKRVYKAEIASLTTELEGLQTEHANLERRNAQLRAISIDKDLLEEEARVMLGRVHKNDMMIFLSNSNVN